MCWGRGVARGAMHQLSNRDFWCLPKVVEELHSLRVCGRAFQSLGAEFEKALKLNCFFACFIISTLGMHKHDCKENWRDVADESLKWQRMSSSPHSSPPYSVSTQSLHQKIYLSNNMPPQLSQPIFFHRFPISDHPFRHQRSCLYLAVVKEQ